MIVHALQRPSAPSDKRSFEGSGDDRQRLNPACSDCTLSPRLILTAHAML